jgi:periplasmic divalent cation tolerance protein
LPDAAILVLTTLPDRAAAEALARSLVEARLAACVNIGAPVDSLYHWRDRIETASEIPVTIKTDKRLFSAVQQAIRGAHPYELPEVIAVPIVDGYRPYLDWIAAETAKR